MHAVDQLRVTCSSTLDQYSITYYILDNFWTQVNLLMISKLRKSLQFNTSVFILG
jgi:hypothetical protein